MRPGHPAWGGKGLPVDTQAILEKLTLEEKCALLAGATAFGTREIKHAGVPELVFSDGPHGIRRQAEGANHLGIGGSLPATCFPTAVTLADTWDTALVEEVGAALGEEACAEGVNVLLGPGICIKRSPLGGRDFEYFSEDPYLAGRMGAAYVRGVQSKGVGACVKHFAANSQETRRQASDSILDERTLREIYLEAFEIVVKEAAPKAVMSSYNRVNGVYANENTHLLQDILFGEWGYQGAVVTDWGGSNDHVAGVAAGSHFEMPVPGLDSTRELIAAVKDGKISQDLLDQRVSEALELILSTHDATANAASSFDEEGHHAVAERAAAAGIVLLKNEKAGEKPLLPLAPKTKVALIGDFAKEPRYQGAGSSLVNPTKLETLLECIQDSGLDFVGYEPGFERSGEKNAERAQAAVALAERADVVLLCLGLPESEESEGMDRTSFELPANQVALVKQLSSVNSNICCLLSSGGAVATDWADEAPALLYLGLGGQAGARAALEVLTGAQNPSGKLAETWPKALADTPCDGIFPSDDADAQYREGIYVGYRYYETAKVPVAFPFGFGLSYTTFAYSNLSVHVKQSDVKTGKLPTATVTFDLKNTGTRAGTEVAEVYISKPKARIFRPAKELKGFAKVALEPGEKKTVTIELDERAFRYFNVATGAWEVEGGNYEVKVGGSSEHQALKAAVLLADTHAPDPYMGRNIPEYRTGAVHGIAKEEFEELLGRRLPEPRVTLDRNTCFRDLNHGRSPIFWIVWLVLQHLVKKGAKEGRPNLNVLFIYNMPLRALAKNAGQFVSMGLVDALVREIQGWGLCGLVPAVIVQIFAGDFFLLVWFLWFFVPLAYEFIKNLVLNARGEKLLAAQDRN